MSDSHISLDGMLSESQGRNYDRLKGELNDSMVGSVRHAETQTAIKIREPSLEKPYTYSLSSTQHSITVSSGVVAGLEDFGTDLLTLR